MLSGLRLLVGLESGEWGCQAHRVENLVGWNTETKNVIEVITDISQRRRLLRFQQKKITEL